MRSLVLFMHVSLDGYVTDASGGMSWVKANEEMFEYAGRQSAKSDLALYGRNTFEMMDAYWPTAGDEPDASKHDKDHSAWYKKVEKLVASKTLPSLPNATIIGQDLAKEINEIKAQGDQDIVMFGSPTLAASVIENNQVDEYWLFVNPVILGEGTRLFPKGALIELTLNESVTFQNGVVGLHYIKK